jgi:hypothetical protein
MKRLIVGLALAALFATSAAAAPDPPLCRGCPTASEAKRLADFLAKQSPPVGKDQAPSPAPVVDPPPTPIPPPVVTPATPAAAPSPTPSPVTQNTVTTTGPVSSDTTISIGTLAGQVLTWAAAAFGSLAATVFTAWGVRLFKLAGVQMSDAARSRLQEIIVNGLNVGAAAATQNLAGKDKVQVKNETVAAAIAYAQSHGADAIKQLGLDPQSGAAVEAIKARIETAIADPTVPTPAVLDPAKTVSVPPAPPMPAPVTAAPKVTP